MLALLLFLASVGLPLPVAIVLVALGAVSAQSSALSLPLLIVLGTLASVSGDLLPYGLGRLGGPRLLGWLRGIRHGILAKPLDRAQGQLQRHGAGMVFLSRFALTAIATPVSLLGGVSRLRLRSFLRGMFSARPSSSSPTSPSDASSAPRSSATKRSPTCSGSPSPSSP